MTGLNLTIYEVEDRLDEATRERIEALTPTGRRRARAHEEFWMEETKLSTKTRKSLPDSAFVFPKEKRYPIHDEPHARNALARASGKAEEGTVRAAVCKRYPNMGECSKKKVQEAESKSEGMQGGGDMKRCPSCDWKNKLGAAKCAKCGVKLRKSGDGKIEEAISLLEAADTEVRARYWGKRLVELVEAVEVSEDEITEAADSLAKASVHEPGLERSPGKSDNWIERKGPGGHGGQLPAYIQHIANDIHEKRGKTISQAIAIAIGVVKRWCRGGGKVDANTKAAACKATAEWMKLRGVESPGSTVKTAAADVVH